MVSTEQKYYTCKFDRPFKEIMLNVNNKDLLKILLEVILKTKINNIVVNNVESLTNNINIKKKQYDVYLITDKGNIEIELNSGFHSYLYPRNMSYICNIYVNHTLVGEDYTENTNIIQINLTYGLNDEYPIRIYNVMDKKGKLFVNNFKIIEVNMEYYEKIWYSKDIKEINKNKYLIMLNRKIEEQEEFLSYVKDCEVEKYMEEINRLNRNPAFIEFMTKEEDQRRIENSLKKELKQVKEEAKQARKQARAEGIKEANLNTALSLKKLGIDIETISKGTGLSIEQVKRL